MTEEVIKNFVKSEEEKKLAEALEKKALDENQPIEEEIFEELKPNKKTWKDHLITAIKLLVGVVMLVVVIHSTKLDSPEEIKKVLLADPTKLLTGLLFVIVAQFLGIKRWQILVEFLKIRVTFWHVTKLHFLGLFCNNLLTAVGGDLVKALCLTNKEQKYQSVLSVMLDRYVGLLVILLVASGAAFSLPKDTFHQGLAYSSWAILLILVFGGITSLLFSETLAQTLERFNSYLEKYKKEHWPDKIRELDQLTRKLLKNYYVVGFSLFLSIVSQSFAILAVHQFSLAVGAKIDAGTMFVIVPIVLLISVIPISPGGLGTREAAFTFLLKNAYITYGLNEEFSQSAAALVALLWLAVNLLISLPGAISYYSVVGNNKK